jgi:hypothetical protein
MDEKKIGDINIRMGDGNTVGDIGHKITFQAPPPSPNAIWQDGRVVGEIGSAPVAGQGICMFQKLFLDGPFDRGREFSVQGVKLKVEQLNAETSASIGGRPPAVTLWNVVCRIVD